MPRCRRGLTLALSFRSPGPKTNFQSFAPQAPFPPKFRAKARSHVSKSEVRSRFPRLACSSHWHRRCRRPALVCLHFRLTKPTISSSLKRNLIVLWRCSKLQATRFAQLEERTVPPNNVRQPAEHTLSSRVRSLGGLSRNPV